MTSITEPAPLEKLEKQASPERRARSDIYQHHGGDVTGTIKLSAGTAIGLVSLAVVGIGGVIALRMTDAAHEQRILALEKAEETRRQIATQDRAELLVEIRTMRSEVQNALRTMDDKIERNKR